MKTLKLLAATVLAVGAAVVLVRQLWPNPADRAPTYDWQCAKCQYHFRLPVRDAAADRPVIECPKCKTATAERVMHFQCRKCWGKYDRRGTQAKLENIVCPACGSRAARDLDHPIPGDDEPVEGGQPYQRK
jgi:putative FmdB family regulatory protein